MKVWFGATTLKFKEYKNYYQLIRQHLVNRQCTLTDDWLAKHGKWLEDNPYATRDIKNIYQKVIDAIDSADVSIIEFTVPNFSTSHQITYSLSKRKPTLVMRLQKDNTFTDSYIEAMNSPYLTVLKYDLSNYKNIIDDFLNYMGSEKSVGRYNIMLSKEQKHYLDWASKKYKQSRSELLRKLIDSTIKTDSNYKEGKPVS